MYRGMGPYVGFQSVDLGIYSDISMGEDRLHLGECVFRQSYSFLYFCVPSGVWSYYQAQVFKGAVLVFLCCCFCFCFCLFVCLFVVVFLWGGGVLQCTLNLLCLLEFHLYHGMSSGPAALPFFFVFLRAVIIIDDRW